MRLRGANRAAATTCTAAPSGRFPRSVRGIRHDSRSRPLGRIATSPPSGSSCRNGSAVSSLTADQRTGQRDQPVTTSAAANRRDAPPHTLCTVSTAGSPSRVTGRSAACAVGASTPMCRWTTSGCSPRAIAARRCVVTWAVERGCIGQPHGTRAAMRCTVTPSSTAVLTPCAPGRAGVVVRTSTWWPAATCCAARRLTWASIPPSSGR